jgi:opacity protein-like surface antigen
MTTVRAIALASTLVLVGSTTVCADATVFLGANTTPEARRVQGVAIGAGLLLFAFEFEYANTPTSDDPPGTAPSLKTGMANALLQAPFAIFRFQPYVTAGAGFYREKLGRHQQTSIAPNVGGGVKVSLIGPLRLRLDYRVFRFGDGALYSPAHRLYAGLNLKF